jgi:hypothetical protein
MTGFGTDGDSQTKEQDFIKVGEHLKRIPLSTKYLNISAKRANLAKKP